VSHRLIIEWTAGAAWPVRAIQRAAEVVTAPLPGEHYLRRPLHHVRAGGFDINRRERFKLGLIERPAARKPVPA
jgi:hypothetical protein